MDTSDEKYGLQDCRNCQDKIYWIPLENGDKKWFHTHHIDACYDEIGRPLGKRATPRTADNLELQRCKFQKRIENLKGKLYRLEWQYEQRYLNVKTDVETGPKRVFRIG